MAGREAMISITRAEIALVLERWTTGQLDAREVHAWAEARFAVDAYEPEDEVANEVLACLDMLDMNLVIAQDVPTLMLALNARTAEEASKELCVVPTPEALSERRRALVDDALYAPFCR